MLDDGKRTGFELVSANGKTATLASIYSDSEVRVSKYGVEIQKFDEFLNELPPVENDNLLYVDEIGQMELYSDKFKELIAQYLDMDNLYAGTISSVYEDDFTNQVLRRSDIIRLVINQNNRELIQEILSSLAANATTLRGLSVSVQKEVARMARRYSEDAQLNSLKKLFKNAIRYIAEVRVDKITANNYLVRGDNRQHSVEVLGNGFMCDCDLFNGTGVFAGSPGECSHVQAVYIFSS